MQLKRFIIINKFDFFLTCNHAFNGNRSCELLFRVQIYVKPKMWLNSTSEKQTYGLPVHTKYTISCYILIKLFEEPDEWGFLCEYNSINTEKFNGNLQLCE